jgi:hypothetical protein
VSIVYDFPAIREALERKPATKAARKWPLMCRACSSALGDLSAPTIVTCKHCGETNHVDE